MRPKVPFLNVTPPFNILLTPQKISEKTLTEEAFKHMVESDTAIVAENVFSFVLAELWDSQILNRQEKEERRMANHC